MHWRICTQLLQESLADTAVVFLQGARQTGKTTLVRQLCKETGRTYLTLDDATTLAAAGRDPEGFIAGLRGPVVIDEVQRVEALALAIKRAVDDDRTPGRFLLTGSARLLVLPQLADALVGRMEVLTLWPLARREIAGERSNLIDPLFSDEPPRLAPGRTDRLDPLLLQGGYPEPLERSHRRRAAWYESYVTTLLQREITAIRQVDDLTALPRLLALIAARTAGLLNISSLSRASGIPNSTLARYLALLEGTFLVHRIPAWSANLGKRLTKSPKIHLVDSGLAAHLQGIDADLLARRPQLMGPLLESWAVGELIRLSAAGDVRPRISHFRTAAGREVDLVLSDRRDRLVGIEIKRSRTVQSSDLRGLNELANLAGERFVRGIVLYGGDDIVPLGERLHALPMRALWEPLLTTR